MAKSSIGSRRSTVEIIFDILSVCSDGANKTAIMYQSNLSHDQLARYLTYLED
jgi:predicted transcriptional regulator